MSWGPRPHPEYEYEYINPSTPEEDFVKWLQALIALGIAYARCPETLALYNVLERIPRKVNGNMKTFDVSGRPYLLYSLPQYLQAFSWFVGSLDTRGTGRMRLVY
jgi:hypothetical protein